MKKILITGSCGFIGFNVSIKLLSKKFNIHGIDNFQNKNSFYKYRLKELKKFRNYKHLEENLINYKKVKTIIKDFSPDLIIHFAAIPGVIYSKKYPLKSYKNNILSTLNILEAMRENKIKNIIFASSSSVYGEKDKKFNEDKKILSNHSSVYSASKHACEELLISYSLNYEIKSLILRFFTVYGPLGREDMSLISFSKKIINNNKITLFRNGKMKRSFTYIDDAVKGVYKSINFIFKKQFIYEIFNIGSSESIDVKNYLNLISKFLKKDPNIKFVDYHYGDRKITAANNKKSQKILGFKANVDIKLGLKKFFNWFIKYINS